MRLVPIPPTADYLKATEAKWNWTRLLPHIAKRGGTPLPELIRQAETGETHIVLIIDEADDSATALIGIRFGIGINGPVAFLVWTTGRNMKAWIHLLPDLERYLKEHQGVTQVKPICRRGWRPMLEAAGYRLTHICMEKDIT
jgi:N-acyl-L-homoserine lactone synthetase